MLHALIERHAHERPNQRAIVCGETELTWRDLLAEVSRAASDLQTMGVSPGDRLCLILPNSPALVIHLLALAKVGAVAVPVDSDSKEAEILPKIKQGTCQHVLVTDRHAEAARRWIDDGHLACARVLDISGTVLATSGKAEDAGSKNESTDQNRPFTGELLELFTSGTTGQPKRVIRSHRSLATLAEAYCRTLRITNADRILAILPLTHGQGLCSGLLAMLQSGATLFLLPSFDRRQTLRLLSEEDITLFSAVPFVFKILGATKQHQRFEAPSLRFAITGGAPLSEEVWQTVRNQLGITLRQSYGSSEVGLVSVNVSADPESTLGSVGQALSCVEISIFGNDGSPLSHGQKGEVAVKSTAASESILDVTGSGAGLKKPLPCPEGWIRTGDLGHLDAQGNLYLAGRIGAIINVAGRKVDPSEVESTLRTHPAVAKARVSPETDGMGEIFLSAKVTLSQPATAGDLQAYCREQLADFKVPRTLHLV